jgi:5-methylcytosine-specific restriction endonuclease McrA
MDQSRIETVGRHRYLICYSKHPLCAECEKHGRIESGHIVDHVIPILQGGALFDECNCQTLCQTCHNRKTAMETKESAKVYKY